MVIVIFQYVLIFLYIDYTTKCYFIRISRFYKLYFIYKNNTIDNYLRTPTCPITHRPYIVNRVKELENELKWIWDMYKLKGFGADTVRPVTGIAEYDGLSTFMVDSLDTLWIYGMKKEFYEARDYV